MGCMTNTYMTYNSGFTSKRGKNRQCEEASQKWHQMHSKVCETSSVKKCMYPIYEIPVWLQHFILINDTLIINSKFFIKEN